MERLKFKVKCDILKKDVNVTYFIDSIKNSDGSVRKKTVQYYNCEGAEQCDDKSNVMQCICFKNMRRIELEVNKTLATSK